MSEEEQKEHIRMIFSASYYPFKNIDALVNNFYSWHQQELERAVAEVKETHKHNYHLGEFSGQKLVFKADGSISHWEYASAHFVCDCGDFKYVLDKKEGK